MALRKHPTHCATAMGFIMFIAHKILRTDGVQM